jgi:hypothetical protein
MSKAPDPNQLGLFDMPAEMENETIVKWISFFGKHRTFLPVYRYPNG